MATHRTTPRKSLPIWVRITVVGVVAFAGIAGTLAYRDVLRQPAADAPLVEFTVEGLHCPVWCTVRLLDSIDTLDGARVESIDQKTGKVIVRHDPARQNVDVLRKVIDARGFAVQASEPVEKR